MSHCPPGFPGRRRKSVQSQHARYASGILDRVRLLLGLACTLCALVPAVQAQDHAKDRDQSHAKDADDGRVLHEYIPAVSAAEARTAEPMRHAAAGEAASRSADTGPGSAQSQRAPAPQPNGFRPDRQTSLEGGLDYYEAFDPSIAPFKRVTAFDDVQLDSDGKTPVLGVRDTRLHVVALEAGPTRPLDRQPRDRFVGEIDVTFGGQRVLPLPSVSPQSRVYSLATTPSVDVQIVQDGADNFFVRARGPVPEGQVHLRWETDAARSYFGSDIPAVPLRDLPKIPPLEASIDRRARRFAAELGITGKSDLKTALDALTEHFRGFVESAEAPENSGDLYLDLCRGEKGLCRHRAYGFVVTARALGIAARFVQNEAHSWVEVELPDVGYVRIDLGGATHGLTAHDTAERQRYVPAQPDTLPRPDAYRQSYAQAAQRSPRSATGGSSEVDLLSSLSGRWLSDESLMGPEPASGEPPVNRSAHSSRDKGRLPTHITLDDKRVSALRGSKLVLTGQVLDAEGKGAPGLRVEIWILQQARRQRMLLAVQVTDQDGYFRADFGVPPDLSVGDYRLVARTQGDATHLPATTE